MGPEMSFSPETQAGLEELFSSGPPHAALGMVQEFTVTSPDSTPGPLPEVEAAEHGAEASPDPEG